MGGSSDVPALRRGLGILRVLAGRAGPMSAAMVARELGLPRSTTYHLLAELEAAGQRQVDREEAAQLGLFTAAPDPIAGEIAQLDLAHLTPIEALNLLAKWQQRIGEGTP
jgi:hypothetical protein